jgi:hypothetical protein
VRRPSFADWRCRQHREWEYGREWRWKRRPAKYRLSAPAREHRLDRRDSGGSGRMFARSRRLPAARDSTSFELKRVLLLAPPPRPRQPTRLPGPALDFRPVPDQPHI